MEPKLVALRSLPSYMPRTLTPKSSASVTPFPVSSTATPSPSLTRQQSLILKEPSKPFDRLAESAGSTAAECTSICCCCPCSLLNLAMLAAVKFPAGLLRQALHRRRKRRTIVGVARKKAGPKVGAMDDDDDFSIHGGHLLLLANEDDAWPRRSPSLELEKEMWAMFYSAGFWRSPS